MENEYLVHHGVKGMKWGRRKAQRTKSGSSRKKGKPTPQMSPDAREAARISKKSVGEMSNDELARLNRRKELENNYHRLNPSTVVKGLAIAGATAAALGTVAKLYKATNATVKIGKEVTNKTIDAAGNYVMKDLEKGLKNFRFD